MSKYKYSLLDEDQEDSENIEEDESTPHAVEDLSKVK